MNVPADLKYTSTHEWVRVEGDVAAIGITDYAQAELGDVVYVDLPETGRSLSSGETFGSVESVKTVSDLYAPISGEVVEANGMLGAQSELVNTDPYGDGYLLRVRIGDRSQIDALMSADAYKAAIS